MPNVLDHLARSGAGASPQQLLEASVAALAHLAPEEDRAQLARCFGRMAPDRNVALPKGPPRATAFAPLSQEQRLVLRAYGHLLLLVRPSDGARARLAQVDLAMGFTEGLALFLRHALSHAKARELVGAGGQEAILLAGEPLRARIDEAVADARRAGPFTRKHPLDGLAPSEYEHPYDRAALAVLEKTPGLSLLVRKLNELGFDRYMRVKHTGSNVRVSERAMPDLHALFRHACEVLALSPLPSLYVQNGALNAFTVGVERPIVVLSSSVVDGFSEDELLFVLGHELGHVKSRHVLYHQIGIVFPLIGEWLASATLGIGKLVTKGMEFALLDWARKSEMTCDRAGLLACQDVDAATTAMMKIGGLPGRYYADADPAHFAEQAREFAELDVSKLDRFAKFLMTLSSSHPWTVIRAAELQKWIAAGEYERVLTAHAVPREVALRPSRARAEAGEAPQADSTCPRCSEAVVPGWRFCIRCGQEIAPAPAPRAKPKPRRNKRAGAQKPEA